MARVIYKDGLTGHFDFQNCATRPTPVEILKVNFGEFYPKIESDAYIASVNSV